MKPVLDLDLTLGFLKTGFFKNNILDTKWCKVFPSSGEKHAVIQTTRYFVYWSKIAIYVSLGLHEVRQATGEAFGPPKRTSSTSKLDFFLHFCRSFWPSWIRIRIPNADPDPDQADPDPQHWKKLNTFDLNNVCCGKLSLLCTVGTVNIRNSYVLNFYFYLAK